MPWVRSPLSTFRQIECAEVEFRPGGQVAIRHSGNPDGPVLIFAPEEWDTFVVGIWTGDFTRPGMGGIGGI